MKVAVIGAGWAGCAAAVEATRRGHQVSVFEAALMAGGRARRVDSPRAGTGMVLDNGQHILIGAYSECLKLMAELGVDETTALLRLPLTLQWPDGGGLKLPQSPWLPAPLDALAGILRARGWSWRDKLSLLSTATAWQLRRFQCPPQQSVADLCRHVSPTIMATLIEPLCVSALNTPAERASGQVFLRVMRDALFAGHGGSNLLLPRTDLSALMPGAALGWLQRHGGQVKLGMRIKDIACANVSTGTGWTVTCAATQNQGVFDRVVLACPPIEAARLAANCGLPCQPWQAQALGLQHEAIATVYLQMSGADEVSGAAAIKLRQPMLALHSTPEFPAQFVFDRGQLGGPPGLLAFVVSASVAAGGVLTRQVLAQAAAQLGLRDLQEVQTIVEKRATFACSPGLVRPGMVIAPSLLACGDYIEGPYPATLEGAVRSGLAAARWLAA
ncbi:MAG: FAD-dependent oxidoreductase [Polaromonas sp.]|nr:MAG: FAD-dependent oxidoreductase [Polaromonas sp.]